jgi:hypothetical protein
MEAEDNAESERADAAELDDVADCGFAGARGGAPLENVKWGILSSVGFSLRQRHAAPGSLTLGACRDIVLFAVRTQRQTNAAVSSSYRNTSQVATWGAG